MIFSEKAKVFAVLIGCLVGLIGSLVIALGHEIARNAERELHPSRCHVTLSIGSATTEWDGEDLSIRNGSPVSFRDRATGNRIYIGGTYVVEEQRAK